MGSSDVFCFCFLTKRPQRVPMTKSITELKSKKEANKAKLIIKTVVIVFGTASRKEELTHDT